MKAQELRIGNLIQYKTVKNPVEVIGTDFETNYVKIKGSFALIDYTFEPIPITKEWLLRLGFTESESIWKGKKNILGIQISNNETLDYEKAEFFIAGINGHKVVTLWNSPKYVHQLQNLYFALTGEELEIKEKV